MTDNAVLEAGKYLMLHNSDDDVIITDDGVLLVGAGVDVEHLKAQLATMGIQVDECGHVYCG